MFVSFGEERMPEGRVSPGMEICEKEFERVNRFFLQTVKLTILDLDYGVPLHSRKPGQRDLGLMLGHVRHKAQAIDAHDETVGGAYRGHFVREPEIRNQS